MNIDPFTQFLKESLEYKVLKEKQLSNQEMFSRMQTAEVEIDKVIQRSLTIKNKFKHVLSTKK